MKGRKKVAKRAFVLALVERVSKNFIDAWLERIGNEAMGITKIRTIFIEENKLR